MIREDEYLERIVAGIQARTTSAATVTWNDVLNGRQFDMSVRFTNGTLTYLVLVEVKDRVRKASASDVEAFVTKARDQLATKAVFVTAAGFQSGAVEVARRHGIELFQVGFDATQPSLGKGAALVISRDSPGEQPHIEFGSEVLVAQIERIALHYANGEKAEFPQEQTQMSYYVKKTTLPDGRSIEDLIATDPIFAIEPNEEQHRSVTLPTPLQVRPPDQLFFKAGVLKEIKFVAVGRMAQRVIGNVRVEPTSFRPTVVYTNVFDGKEYRFDLDQLPLNFDPLQVGGYYCQEHPLRYYYCDGISDGLVTWVLVESFQNADLVQAIFTQKEMYAPYMVPVRDKVTLNRLERRLKDVRARG